MVHKTTVAAASTIIEFTLPNCTRPHCGLLIRGLESWVKIGTQVPSHWPPHCHPEFVYVMVTLGRANCLIRCQTDTQQYFAEREIDGEYVWIVPSGVMHEIQWRAEAPMLRLFIKKQWIESLIGRCVNVVSLEPLKRYVAFEPTIGDLCRRIRHHGCVQEPPNRAAVAGLGAALAAELLLANESLCAVDVSRGPRLSGLALEKIYAYVREHLPERLTLAQLAWVVGLSPSYFGQMFRSGHGSTPIAYVISQRVQRARKLLTVGHLSVKEIAHEVGFADQSQMARHFRAADLATPRSYLPPR
ncbi:MAG: AraC family transcriptional regulator [Opitutaceae bacterium]|nr:AraC family transcriptional regulator [Opitutaceae bacterium]